MTIVPSFSRGRRALAAVALGVAALLPSAGVAAQISQGTWYESLSTSCSATTTCALTFTAIGAGKTLVARNVSCRMVTPNKALITNLSVSGAGTTYIPVGAPQVTFASQRWFFASAEIFSTFIAGQTPRVSFSSGVSGNLILSCSLSGELRP